MGLFGQNSSALTRSPIDQLHKTLTYTTRIVRASAVCAKTYLCATIIFRYRLTPQVSSPTEICPGRNQKKTPTARGYVNTKLPHTRLGLDSLTRKMSNEMEQAADAILQAAQEASFGELSEVDVDGDGSSSLSEIEYHDNPQDEEAEASDDRSNDTDEENDSEAETERLEQSPNLTRIHKDVVLSSTNDDQIYERSPSKLDRQILADDQGDDEEEDALSDDEISVHESHKSSVHGEAAEPTTVATSLEDSPGEGKRTLSATDADTRKRKRSIMAGSGLDNDIEEPLRKRTGSIITTGDDYAVEDDELPDEEGDTSNPISGNISGEECGENEEDMPDEVEEPVVAEEEAPETTEITVSPKKRGRKKKKPVDNGVNSYDEEQEASLEETTAINGDDEIAENDGDEAEAAIKNEEERKSLFNLC